MAEVFPARSGDLTASVAGTLLHSRYDPGREAARFLDAGLADRTPATLLLLGAGLGYLATEARSRFPTARIILVSLTDTLRTEHAAAADDVLMVAGGVNAQRQLERLIRPADVAGLELLEWEPAVRAAPEAGAAAAAAVREVLARRNAEIATTAHFGRRYIRNALRGALFLAGAKAPWAPEVPVCVAASGPGLERAVPWIARNRSHIELWALSSAWEALSERGLEPDVVVHQDAGYYAGLHLARGARRQLQGTPAASVLMPLTAVMPPRPLRTRTFMLSQNTRIEADLLGALGRTPPRVDEAPTVAATAAALALAMTDVPVYLAGLDLCRDDIRAHARPHAFEAYFRAREHRLDPLHSRIAADSFDRSTPTGVGHMRTEPSLNLYASWFRELPTAVAERLRRVAPSPVDIGAQEAERDVKNRGGGHDRTIAGNVAAGPVPAGPTPFLAVIDTWAEEVEAFAAGAADSELAYLVSAPDYVALLAARRRGDHDAATLASDRLRVVASALFSRLQDIAGAAEAGG